MGVITVLVLDLSVGDLVGSVAVDDLSVWDLVDSVAVDDLAIVNLDSGGVGWASWNLELAVGDLGDAIVDLTIWNLTSGIDLSISDLAARAVAGARHVRVHAVHAHGRAVAWDSLDVNRLALLSNSLVVDVEEIARSALVEDGRVTESQVAGWLADGPSGSVDGASLGWWPIELELAVGDDGANAALGVGKDTVIEVGNEGALARASVLSCVS